MKHRALIKKFNGCSIAWLFDLPGLNAQEKSRGILLESLRISEEDMHLADVHLIPSDTLTKIDVLNPNWIHEGL